MRGKYFNSTQNLTICLAGGETNCVGGIVIYNLTRGWWNLDVKIEAPKTVVTGETTTAADSAIVYNSFVA